MCFHGISTAGRLDEVAVSTEEQRNRRRTWPAPLQLGSAKRHPVGALRRAHLCWYGACTAGRLEEVAVSTEEQRNRRRTWPAPLQLASALRTAGLSIGSSGLLCF